MEIIEERFLKTIKDFNQIFSFNFYYPYQSHIITPYDLVRSPLRRKLLEKNFNQDLEVKFFFKQFIKNLFPVRLRERYYLDDFIIDFYVNKIDSSGNIFNYHLITHYSYLNKFLRFYEREMQIIKFLYEKKYSKKVSNSGNIFFIIDYSFKENKLESPVIEVKYNDDPDIEKYLNERIKLHKEGSFCSEEDMMIDLNFVAGGKKFKFLHEAQNYALKNKKEIKKEIKPVGCLFYCPVKNFCPQFKVIS